MLDIAKKYNFDVQFVAVNYRNKFPQTGLRLIPQFDIYTDFIPWRTIVNIETFKMNDEGYVELVINADVVNLSKDELNILFSELRRILEIK